MGLWLHAIFSWVGRSCLGVTEQALGQQVPTTANRCQPRLKLRPDS
jgi:hypothetical protein